jgi:hypothetical protein
MRRFRLAAGRAFGTGAGMGGAMGRYRCEPGGVTIPPAWLPASFVVDSARAVSWGENSATGTMVDKFWLDFWIVVGPQGVGWGFRAPARVT